VTAFAVRDDEIGDRLDAILTDAKRYRALRESVERGEVQVIDTVPRATLDEGNVFDAATTAQQCDEWSDDMRDLRRERALKREGVVQTGAPVPSALANLPEARAVLGDGQ
jgi:hypothetical protein